MKNKRYITVKLNEDQLDMIQYALKHRLDCQDCENNKEILCRPCEIKLTKLLGMFMKLIYYIAPKEKNLSEKGGEIND